MQHLSAISLSTSFSFHDQRNPNCLKQELEDENQIGHYIVSIIDLEKNKMIVIDPMGRKIDQIDSFNAGMILR